MSEPTIDGSTEAVERLAARRPWWADGGADVARDTLRALAAERDAAESARVEAVRLLSDASTLYARALSRAEAAEARASEQGAYRTAAAAFLASKGMLPEFDAWCAERGMPADAVGALVEVARAAREVGVFDAKTINLARALRTLDALHPELLDQSDPEG